MFPNSHLVFSKYYYQVIKEIVKRNKKEGTAMGGLGGGWWRNHPTNLFNDPAHYIV